ncbi:MAG TPA: methyltransferase domain-containing protein [Nocardioides sp.]|nr:methyltransferase domain-containing protein [Nocardioides sp.]
MIDVEAPAVDPTNIEQAQAWDGDEGAFWAAHAAHFDRSVAGYHAAFVDAAGIVSTDRVLDIGCGTGQDTRDAARAAASGRALGVDLSTRMIAYARNVASREGLDNVAFEAADAQVHPFTAEGFDVAISRTGAMFFGDPVAAFTNIARALRPGGRMSLLVWQGVDANEWFRELSTALAAGRDLPMPPPSAPGPFSLADPERVRSILGAAGLTDIRLEPLAEGMWFGEGPDHAERFVLDLLGWMLDGLDEEGRERAVQDLRGTLAAHSGADGVVYGSATWAIRATRP